MTTISIGRAILFSLLVLSFVGAASAVNVCEGDSPVPTEFVFTNDGSVIQNYVIQKSGPAASWTSLNPTTGFRLLPGQSKVVVGFTSIPATVNPGVYSLNVMVSSDTGYHSSQSVDFSVGSCHIVSVSAPESVYDGCINKALIIPLTIHNDGRYLERINLSSSVGSLSIDSLVLDVGDSQLVNLIVTPDSLGADSITVTAVTPDSESTFLIGVNVNECVFFNASLSSSYVNLCENQEELITLNIWNNNETNTYYFNSSSYYIDLPNSVTLSPNQLFSQQVTVYSGCDSGVVNPLINIWTAGSRVIGLPLVINARACYKPIIVVDVKNSVACACESVSYPFTIYNPGDQSMTYSLSSSVGQVLLDGSPINQLTLPIDGSEELTIDYVIPCGFSGDLNVSLFASAISACAKQSVDSVIVDVKSWNNCETVAVNAPTSIPVNESDLVLPVSVSNVGVRPASYNLVVTGSGVSNLLGVSKSFITLNPGETEVVELTFSAANITGAYVNVQAFSVDNVVSDSAMITFGGFLLNYNDFYLFLLPSAVIVLMTILLLRGKVFKNRKDSKDNAREIKIKKAEIRK
ncbi:MAG: hypothetical protein WC307_00010 [Candidatus Nanoarchaeia archaeon]|jgi:hypothetical protein